MYTETILDQFNRYVTKGNITTLIITERDGNEIIAKIDTEDRERVEAMGSWSLRRGRCDYNYIGHTVHHGQVYMLHRFVTNAPDHKTVMFRSDDHYDCRKSNLVPFPLCQFRARADGAAGGAPADFFR